MGEVIALLAARAPRLDRALKKITKAGGEAVLIDGTLIRTRRRSGNDNRKKLLRQAQNTRPALPRHHRYRREPAVDLRRQARPLLRDHHRDHPVTDDHPP
ncbi:hypothetical protein AB0M44_22620 [Streptosporangium subroseum]|uniref:hypothetical protein n=1 Tax=Streptosporangium subroseum TaxID=106412 RepID=UPI00344A7AB7